MKLSKRLSPTDLQQSSRIAYETGRQRRLIPHLLFYCHSMILAPTFYSMEKKEKTTDPEKARTLQHKLAPILSFSHTNCGYKTTRFMVKYANPTSLYRSRGCHHWTWMWLHGSSYYGYCLNEELAIRNKHLSHNNLPSFTVELASTLMPQVTHLLHTALSSPRDRQHNNRRASACAFCLTGMCRSASHRLTASWQGLSFISSVSLIGNQNNPRFISSPWASRTRHLRDCLQLQLFTVEVKYTIVCGVKRRG